MRFAMFAVVSAIWLGSAAVCRAAPSSDSADIVIADFEGTDYGAWKVTGDAFGAGPARGTLANQMPVSGFEGHGLLNSYNHGDNSVGTLTSPEFRIERKYVNFLIGGGNRPGEAGVNLLLDGKAVRTATGDDNERLDWASWDVGNFLGKTVQIEIIDRATGGWGHILVDQIVQSSERKGQPAEPAVPYHESLRPQFHFTARTNWLNDPNGLVFYKGEYHLFFQHNPQGINWGNMTWGHAVSTDLLHWKQLDDAIPPDHLGTIFSGSAVVDWNNTSGLQAGDENPIIAIYTSAGGTSPASNGQPFTQSIAASNDLGRTWKKYDHNPVLANVIGSNRDPKVFWHEGTKKWIMALFLDGDKYALFSSPNLTKWTRLSDIPEFGAGECPDLFEMPIEGIPGQTRWIFWGANKYLVGSFDGKKFVKESGPHIFEHGSNYYAAQTYSDIPSADGRRIQIAWMAGGQYPHMPFNQQMAFPAELVLRQTPEGPRLFKRPVRELDTLHGEHFEWHGTLKQGENPLASVAGDLLDVRIEIDPATAPRVSLTIRGARLDYDAKTGHLGLLGKTADLTASTGKAKPAAKIELQILLDRTSIEVFADDGQLAMSSCFIPADGHEKPPLQLEGDGAKIESLDVWQLKSCWPE